MLFNNLWLLMQTKEITKKTNVIKNNVLKTGSGPDKRTTVSSFSLPQSITTTHINGICITYTAS